MTAAWMAAHDGGSVVEVVLVVGVLVVVVVGSTRVQSVSAQWLAPGSIVRSHRPSPAQDRGSTARQCFAPPRAGCMQHTTACGRPQVEAVSNFLQRRRSVPAASAVSI